MITIATFQQDKARPHCANNHPDWEVSSYASTMDGLTKRFVIVSQHHPAPPRRVHQVTRGLAVLGLATNLLVFGSRDCHGGGGIGSETMSSCSLPSSLGWLVTGIIGTWVLVLAGLCLLRWRYGRKTVSVFDDPLEIAFLKHLPERMSNDPRLLVDAVRRLVAGMDDLAARKFSRSCVKLLEDDAYADDVVGLVRAVVDDECSVMAARSGVEELSLLQKGALAAQAEHDKVLLEVQPDYSDDIDRLVERHRLWSRALHEGCSND